MLFFRVLIFLCFSWSMYIQPARSPRCSRRKEGKDRKELLFELYSQFPGDFCPFALISTCYSWQIRWMHCFIQERNRLLSLPLSVSFKHGPTPNGTLSSKHHSQPVPAGECQTVHCKALHPLKHCTSNKTSLADFSYTQHAI